MTKVLIFIVVLAVVVFGLAAFQNQPETATACPEKSYAVAKYEIDQGKFEFGDEHILLDGLLWQDGEVIGLIWAVEPTSDVRVSWTIVKAGGGDDVVTEYDPPRKAGDGIVILQSKAGFAISNVMWCAVAVPTAATLTSFVQVSHYNPVILTGLALLGVIIITFVIVGWIMSKLRGPDKDV